MNFTWRNIQVAALLISSAVPTVAQEIEVVRDWKIVGPAGNVTSGSGYCLQNQTIGNSIRYGKRGAPCGANLVWDESSSARNVHLENKDGGPIRFGEPIALRVDGSNSPYVRYEQRTFGINLGWSSQPVYEWIIVGGQMGTRVRTNQQIAVINQFEKDFLVYARRPGCAINLRWYKDRNGGGNWDWVARKVREQFDNPEDVLKLIGLL